MGRRRLRHGVVRFGLDRMHEVRELHRVLDEEHRHVVAHQVPVAIVGIELHREAAHVARGILRAALSGDGREAHEDRGPLAFLLERRRARDVGERFVGLEEAMRTAAAGVDDPFGNPFMVEVGDLLAKDEVLQQRGAADAGLERMLIVPDRYTLIRRQPLPVGIDAYAREGSDAGILAGSRRRARLSGVVGFGERAACGDLRDRDMLAFSRRDVAAFSIFLGLVRIERQRCRGALRLGGARGSRVRVRRRGCFSWPALGVPRGRALGGGLFAGFLRHSLLRAHLRLPLGTAGDACVGARGQSPT